ncbi:hypothetical protein CIHG_03599 [Coccidioides immitis H538.4]|uniref:Uncharacterized protein n=1 Tax=Coccidioides immitis H538.4 TaxID=396776 RepID=A0A0J8RNH2_COCIT|nr:hypothetical protein CIHG_03599 [Coccidioides immitis H538.4]
MGGISARDESTPPAFTPRGKLPLPEHGEQWSNDGVVGSTALSVSNLHKPARGSQFQKPRWRKPGRGELPGPHSLTVRPWLPGTLPRTTELRRSLWADVAPGRLVNKVDA